MESIWARKEVLSLFFLERSILQIFANSMPFPEVAPPMDACLRAEVAPRVASLKACYREAGFASGAPRPALSCNTRFEAAILTFPHISLRACPS